ncbi:TrkA family potassium uptake protein [Helicobacter sp. MIT 03-1614]|jgi:trk system potassium uptake protein TrkA|uniref:RCK N-terminal domain-containing protein n=2 Tax=Helicobacter TaxID=209 RepID=Q7VGW4_HELHP|nr:MULTISPECIES: TrkA family potassium uptake protein [Helicobacter]AAP77803.1 conserved hypothetical protein [Helicobacter hepaticus ATCC 51449]TLD90875.1 TrkA family potassium uptake protein [Helicobacter sp. MIT 03-1614]
MKTSYAVIGLGKFGQYVAKGLIRNNENVIVCDDSEEHIREFKDLSDEVYILDATNKEALREAGVKELDVVIISIGENIESSILSVIALQELKNKFIIAKAVNRSHGIILNRLGVDLVVRPEQDASSRLLDKLLWNRNHIFKINEQLDLSKVPIIESDVGKSVGTKQYELQMRENVKIIGVYQSGIWHIHTKKAGVKEPLEQLILEQGAVLLLLQSHINA